MSRKPSSLNSPYQDSDRHQDSDSQTPVVSENSSWPKLWGKLILNGYQSSEESNTEPEPSPTPKNKLNFKQLRQFFSKYSKGNKHYFDPKKLQKEILEEIGQQLYKERQKQGLSLEVIEEETCISVGLLEAIEKAKLEELPEAIYTRSFIKKFANFLGLDGKSLSESFPLDTASKSNRYGKFRFLFPFLQFRAIHLYFLYIIIVLFSVQGISNTLKRAALEGEIKQPQIPVTVSPSPPQPIKKPVMVQVESTGESSLTVTIDGKIIFDEVLAKDTKKTWTAKENITIEANDAGLILVTFNNKNPKPLGKLGESKTVTYVLPNISD